MAIQTFQYSGNDLAIFTNSLDELPVLTQTLNTFSFSVSNEDLGFSESLQISDVLLEDQHNIEAAA